MGGGGSSNTTTTQKADPWAAIQPQLLNAAGRYETLSNAPYEAFPGQKLAPLDPYQSQGLQMTANRAMAGSPVMGASQANLLGTLKGDYLNPSSNPFLQNNVQTAMDQARGTLNRQFNRPGAFGSTAHQGVLGRELGKIAMQGYGQNYDAERNRQMQANLFAPQSAQADYMDAQQLAGVGDTQRAFQQEQLNQGLADWQEKKNYPMTMADWYGQRVAQLGGMGGTSTTNAPNPNQTSPLAGAAGGALTGYGLASTLGMAVPGWGALAGGVLGLLGSR